MLIAGAGILRERLDEARALVCGDFLQEHVREDDLQGLCAAAFLERVGCVGVTVGIGEIGLDVVDGGLSARSAPAIYKTGPSFVWRFTSTSFTQERPIGFGRNGERVAKTPTRVLPPSFGGATVGENFPSSMRSKCQRSHR